MKPSPPSSIPHTTCQIGDCKTWASYWWWNSNWWVGLCDYHKVNEAERLSDDRR